jgi:hypothetical protein
MTIVGFDDGFSARFGSKTLPGSLITGSPVNNGPVISEVYVTAKPIEVAATKFAAGNGIHIVVSTTGSPTIGSWDKAASNMSKVAAVRHQLYGDDPRPAILYAGGYVSFDV